MARCSAHRLTTTFLVVLSLLFSQLALASYACPPAASAAVEPMAMEMAAGEPCAGMDEGQPVLCHQHCIDATQAFEPLQLPPVSLPAVVQVLVVPLVLVDADREPAAYADAWQARPPPEPLFLSTLRLRV